MEIGINDQDLERIQRHLDGVERLQYDHLQELEYPSGQKNTDLIYDTVVDVGRSGPFTSRDIESATDLSGTAILTRLNSLRVRGVVDKSSDSMWVLEPWPPEPEPESVRDILDVASGYGLLGYSDGGYGHTNVQCIDEGCWRGFESEKNMRIHYASAHGESISEDLDWPSLEPHKCPDCGRTYSTKGAMERHRNEIHEESDEVGNACPHPKCNRTGLSDHGIKVHYGRVHEGSIAETERARQLRES